MRDYEYKDMRISTREIKEENGVVTYESAVTVLNSRTRERESIGPAARDKNKLFSKSKAMDLFNFPSNEELRSAQERRAEQKKRRKKIQESFDQLDPQTPRVEEK